MLRNSESARILLILKSLGVNYPILKSLGADLRKLLLLVVGEGQTKAAVDFFSDADIPVLSERMVWKRVAAILTDANSTWVIFPYPHSRKGLDFLMSLATAVQVGEIEGSEINALPLVVSEGIPQNCDLSHFFTVYLEGDLGNDHLNGKMVVPPDEQVAVVLDKIREHAIQAHSSEERALLAAACFLYPNMLVTRMKNVFPCVLECAGHLAWHDEDNRDAGGLAEAFVKELYRWQEKTGFSVVYELPHLGVDLSAELGRILLFDSRFIYVKTDVFKEISWQLLKVFSTDLLKWKLAEAGIICPEGGGATYTAKVGYYGKEGVYRRERMLRFDRKRLNISGELEFVDLCLNAGGNENGSRTREI